ncbi:MAG: hypothetical protein PHN59_03085 [Candidatus Omnitrophica bacterium]|nr:hypothetical protein [Candidatus Omnitrophota bacterium]
MILSIFMNFMVLATAWALVFRVLRLPGRVDSLLALLILYFSQIIFSELLLGAAGKLFLFNLCLLQLLILCVVTLATYNKTSTFSISQYSPALKELLKSKLVLFMLCVILAFGANKILINLANPPFGWDSLNYHFTFPVEWLKNATLNNPITIFDDPSPSYYPINGSLYYLWLIVPLRNVFLADIGQAPFFLAAFLAVFDISRKLKLNYQQAFYASGLFLLIPNFFKQLSFAYVDVMIAALFLTCINFLLALKERFNWSNMLIFCLSFGLFIGTKTTALVFGVLLILPFFCLALSKKRIILALLLFAGALIALGGYSYIRNFLETKDPLYPLNLGIFGINIFHGVMDNSIYRAHFTLKDYAITKLLFHEGLGAQAVLFIFPATLAGFLLAIIKRRKLGVFMAYFLMLPLLIYLAYRYLIPLANARYLYALFGLGMVIGIYLMKEFKFPKIAVTILAALTAISSAFQLAKRQELTTSLILTLIFLIILPILLRAFRKVSLGGIIKPVAVFCVCVIFLLLCFMERNYRKNEFPGYIKMEKYSGFWPDATRAWNWLNSNTSGENIAYTGRPVAFPLYGSNFKNNAYYVSINCTDPVKLHNFTHSRYTWGYDFESLHKNLEEDQNYRGKKDYTCWLNNLLRRKTNYLFVYSLHQTKEIIFPVEDTWARDNPNNFLPVFTNQTIHIYRLK